MFTSSGPSEHDVRRITLPAFIETEPGSFKPLDECSRNEVEAEIHSLLMQAQALMDEAKTLGHYLDGD